MKLQVRKITKEEKRAGDICDQMLKTISFESERKTLIG